jgi:hypothetical protein
VSSPRREELDEGVLAAVEDHGVEVAVAGLHHPFAGGGEGEESEEDHELHGARHGAKHLLHSSRVCQTGLIVWEGKGRIEKRKGWREVSSE